MRRSIVLAVLLVACAKPVAPARVDLPPPHDAVATPVPRRTPAFAWTARDLAEPVALLTVDRGVLYLAGPKVFEWSSDRGATFVATTLPRPASRHDRGEPRALWARDGRIFLATSYTLWASSDRGASWSVLAEPKLPGVPGDIPSPIEAVFGSGADLYFATNVGEVHHSSDGGRSWRAWNSQTGGAFLALGGAGGRVVVAGCFGFFFRSDDRGASWTGGHSIGNDVCSRAVAASDPRHFVVVGAEHQVARSDDGGAHWARAEAGIDANAIAVGQGDDWTVVGDGIARSLDGGATWRGESISLGPPAPWVDEAFRSCALVLQAVSRAGGEAYALGRRAMPDGEMLDTAHAVLAIAR